jgi:lysozyme
MMDRNKLIEELKFDEGFIDEIYEDHLGLATFGVGHLILEHDPVSDARIRECLNNDIDIVCSELDKNLPWWRGLGNVRQRVLANMCFNLGYPRFSKFKKFLEAVKKEDWETAGVEMLDSKWATQVGDRAIRLKEKMYNG